MTRHRTPTPDEIAEGIRQLETSGCALRQLVEARKAQVEVQYDLAEVMLRLGEESPCEPGKFRAACDD